MDKYMTIPATVFMAALWATGQGDAQNALMGTTNQITRLNATVVPAPDGQFIGYQDFAAYAWHDGKTEIPERPDGLIDPATGVRTLRWPILALPAKGNPAILWYGEGKFRSPNWTTAWATPVKWAYVRLEPEIWDPVAKQHNVPGLVDPQPPAPSKGGVHIDDVAGQQLVDILKRSFTTKELQDKMDASPYDEPDTGAPEPLE